MKLLLISPGDHGVKRDLGRWLRLIRPSHLLLREFQASAAELNEVIRVAHAINTEVIVHEGCEQHDTLLPSGMVHQRSTQTQSAHRFGRSCHSTQEVKRAFEQGANYVLLSPFARPISKPLDPRCPLLIDNIRCAASMGPCLILGGVRPESLAAIDSLGAAGAAILGGVFNQPSPKQGAKAWSRYLAAARQIHV